LRSFEALIPRWAAQYQLAGPGNYSFVPDGLHDNVPSMYGCADVLTVWWIAGQLDAAFSQAQRTVWAEHLTSFQNATDGSFIYHLWESSGFEPWHADATGAIELRMLQPTPPPHQLRWLDFMRGPGAPADVARWDAFYAPLLNSTGTSIWATSHAIAGLPISASMYGAAPGFAAFYDWYFAWLRERQDPLTGYWGNSMWRPPRVDQLGGTFHLLIAHKRLNRTWPRPELIVNTTLATQHEQSGLWSSSNNQVEATFIDLDGIFSALQSSLLAGRYRWADVEHMCRRFLASQTPLLTTPARVLGGSGPWSATTHVLMAPMAAVAECQFAFPGMVRTNTPWRDNFAGFAPW